MMKNPETVLSAFGKWYMLFHADAHILVGFSGGSDSVALLSALYALQKRQFHPFALTALHVHHGIRGAEADRDAAFCRSFCEQRGISYFEFHRDVPAYAKEHHLSMEDAAREVRYTCFSEYLTAHAEISCLMTAHHADDQAETVFFRLLRGTGLRGLTGIPEKRMIDLGTREVPVCRPFLTVSKAELLSYCRENGLSFICDSSNAENDCSRNLLRNEILPDIRKINPAFTIALQHLSEQAALDEDYFTRETDRILSELDGFSELPLSRLRALHPALLQRVLYALYARALFTLRFEPSTAFPLSASHIAAMRELLTENVQPKEIHLPAELSFSVFPAGDLCGFTEKTNDFKTQDIHPLDIGTPAAWQNGSVCFIDDGSPESRKNLQDLKNIHKLFISTPINYATIKERVFLRGRSDAKNDRYLCGGSEKNVKDALSAHKVHPAERKTIPLFCDRDGILWVPFCGIRDSVNPRYAENPDTVTFYYFYKDKGAYENAAPGH